MPGSPILHGYATSTSAQGEGGAARASSASLVGTGNGTDVAFFVWLVVIGVVVPLVILGGLRFGHFQFVFKGR
jgi:hypothetical protein